MKRYRHFGVATGAVLMWSPGHQSSRIPRGAYVALVLVVMLVRSRPSPPRPRTRRP